MTDTPDTYAPKKRPSVVDLSDRPDFIRHQLEPAPSPRPEQHKVGDLMQLAGWIDAISFLDLLELTESIVKSEADAGLPAEVKLAKALATWARAAITAKNGA